MKKQIDKDTKRNDYLVSKYEISEESMKEFVKKSDGYVNNGFYENQTNRVLKGNPDQDIRFDNNLNRSEIEKMTRENQLR